jgi:hypothetical protein
MTKIKVSDFSLDPQEQTSEPLTRTLFREAVAEVAERARATLPQAVNSRIEKAVAIVLAGDVELMSDNRAVVGSQSDATLHYVVDGVCECPDSDRPEIETWCKHKIAACLQKRAEPLARRKLHAYHDAQQATKQSLPEAPASANCYVTLAGRNVQLTLRDSDEGRLLSRLEALLLRFPVTDDSPASSPASEPPEGWCPIHQVQMKRFTKGTQSWWSHKTEDGWCKGR